jgi:hypothetical protein
MADPAAYAQEQIDEWHGRLIANQLARPSPSITTALVAGYAQLMVYCEGCHYSSHVPLRTIRRPRGTQLIDLAPLLICERCGKHGPLPQIAGVSR